MNKKSELDRKEWIRQAIQDYQTPLISYVRRFLHDPERARDVVQDCFLKLCQQEREKIEDYLAQWLYTVARNRAFEILRKEKRMTEMSENQMAVTPTDAPGPEDQAIRKDEHTRVTACIKTLPDREQELIRLKFQHELSYKEIANVMDLSVSNVGYLLHKAIQTLRQQINQDEMGQAGGLNHG